VRTNSSKWLPNAFVLEAPTEDEKEKKKETFIQLPAQVVQEHENK
jgi:hypothetical protein